METKEKKVYKNHRVMNNSNDITKRTSSINPLSTVGASAMGFPEKVSTTRSGMATKHASQRVVITNPEFARLYSGAENAYGDRSSYNVYAKDDYELIKIFRKFRDFEISPVLYLFKNLATGKYICHLYKPAENLIEKYGFRMIDNIAGKYREGDIIPKYTTISQSSSYVNQNYCAGINARFAFAVLPELTEDALLISSDLGKKLEYDLVDPVVVKISKDAYLLNRYGNNEVYKPFPNIGEYINDGILASIRENSYVSSIAEASVPHINDKYYFTNGIVVDIDIQSNIEVENEQFNYYLKEIKNWYSEIYQYTSNIITDPYQDEISLTDIHNKAEKYLNDFVWCTKEEIINTRIEFTILHHKEIKPGQKVAGRMGNKSVVCTIVPTEEMPRTDDGRPLDMVANGLAIPNRIIAFATYEASITFIFERMHQHICKLNDQNAPREEIMSYVYRLFEIFDPYQSEELKQVYEQDPDAVFNDIIKNGLNLRISPFNTVIPRDAIVQSYTEFPDIMQRYTVNNRLVLGYTNGNVLERWIPSEEKHAIGYQYLWVLKQESSKTLSTVATGRTTLYDLHVKTSKFKNHLLRYSANPIRFGEYDTYNLLEGISVKNFAKIATYFRGSQYTDNSILMSQLNDVNIDLSKYNNFPQLDNLKNILKFTGIKLIPNEYGYNNIGNFDEMEDVLINNNLINISKPQLRRILLMYSYYMKYQSDCGGTVDIAAFFDMIIKDTDIFDALPDSYKDDILNRFIDLLPILKEIKTYD